MNPTPRSNTYPGESLTVCHAAGMVMAQLNVDIDEAEAKLRSYALAMHRPLSDVANDIVSRRLHLDRPLQRG
jgi:AmiR/NasT family two-component response regulator